MEVLKKKQRKILKKIRKEEFDGGELFTGVLNEISVHSEEEVIYAMGDFGRSFRNFARDIDLRHPDLKSIFLGEMVNGGEFSRIATDHLKLCTYGKTWGLSDSVLKSLKRSVTSNSTYKELKGNIDSPSLNLRYLRFVKTKAFLKLYRSEKRAQSVHLIPEMDAPKDFDDYFHGFLRYENDIKEAKKRMARLEDSGLLSMAEEIQIGLNTMIKESQLFQYMGFNKINLVKAAVILGNMIGCVHPSDRYIIPEGTFEGQAECRYLPRVYPYHELEDIASDEMKSLVDYLDEYPPLGRRTLFDHFRVLVPGGEWQESIGSLAHSSMERSAGLSFPDVLIGQKRIDETLIRKGMTAILLGERDGEHYFVSYWM